MSRLHVQCQNMVMKNYSHGPNYRVVGKMVTLHVLFVCITAPRHPDIWGLIHVNCSPNVEQEERF